MAARRPLSHGSVGGVERLRADLTGRGLELVRAWPRGPEHLLLHVRAPGQDWVAGQWFADDARAAQVAARTSRADSRFPGTTATTEPVGSSRTPEVGVRHLPGSGVVLQPAGWDRRLPGLRPLLREPGSGLVAHRPERRAVVRDAAAQHFTKVVPPARVRGLLTSAGWQPDGVQVPEVVAVDHEAGTVVTRALPGRTLHELGDDAPDGAWRAAGALLASLHATPAPPHARPHDVQAESDVTRGWLERAARHRALSPARVAQLWAVTGRAVARLGADRRGGRSPVTSHRDLHDKQVMVTGDDAAGWSAAVLDLDLLALAEPALDVANLLVHLVLRDEQAALCAGSVVPRAQQRAVAFLDGYGQPPEPGRVQALAVVAAARVAAVYAFRQPLVAGHDPGTGPCADVGGAVLGQRLTSAVAAGLPGLPGPSWTVLC